MEIHIACDKIENESIKSFAEFYLSSYHPEIKELHISCPDKEHKEHTGNQGKSPDYFWEELKIVIEIKRVLDREELENTTEAIKKLQKDINNLSNSYNDLKTRYSLEGPFEFKIKKRNSTKVAKSIVDAIVNGKNQIEEDIGVFKIIHKEENKNGKIILEYLKGPGKSINPAETIRRYINISINKANQQLGAIKEANKKILLLKSDYFYGLSNSYIYGNKPAFIEAICSYYDDLLKCDNIDEIWFQIGKSNENYSHFLLYKKDLLVSLDQSNFKSISKDDINLFEEWFCPLKKLDNKYNDKLFKALKELLKEKKPYEIFKNKSVREQMVCLGIWLAEEERYNDVLWIIEKFIDDPDPEEPDKFYGDSKYNYHKKIANGEDVKTLKTVLGHLCRVIEKLAVKEKFIDKALKYTKILLTHKNIYIKLQAIYPLISISANRQWLKGWGERPREGEYKEFHKQVFDLLDLVKKNPNYKAIGNLLCNVFSYYKDLSTQECEQVLNTLKVYENAATLFIYFAIFRHRDFKEQNIEFNRQIINEKLIEIIKSNDKKYQKLKVNISYGFYDILKNNENEFCTIRPYIELFLEQTFDNDLYHYIQHIINEFIKNKPDICIRWYKTMLSKLSDYIKNSDNKSYKEDIWLESTENILDIIAINNPNELYEIVNELIFLLQNGVCIGHLKRIFESYKLIPDQELKLEVKRKFQELYNSIKKDHDKIEDVDWE